MGKNIALGVFWIFIHQGRELSNPNLYFKRFRWHYPSMTYLTQDRTSERRTEEVSRNFRKKSVINYGFFDTSVYLCYLHILLKTYIGLQREETEEVSPEFFYRTLP